jgi:hypothetical protein
MGQLRRRKHKLKIHRTSEVEQLKRRRYKQRYHRTLEEGVRKKKNQREFRNKVKVIPTPEEEMSKIQHLEIEP